MSALEDQFHGAMVKIYEQGKRECGYNATVFLRMLSEKGGLATARSLLSTNEPSSGFTALWECGRLDLTVEAHVVRAEFGTLFTEQELAVARERLEKLDYDFGAK